LESVLRSGQLPPMDVISTILINDILGFGREFLLILDDFHVIQDHGILEFLEILVTNLPQPLHLIMLSREDPPLPLAQLRGHNRLTEVRARDLRFTSRDIERFLNEVMNLSLSQRDITTLEDKTEGWIVGLQLAGLSMRDRVDPSGFITTLSGSHRHILGYLTEEVLNRQPEDIQRFLLQTSILDKLNGDLCDAVTGRSDSRILLEHLFNANLFLIPLDDDGQWYRYHHLFADLLRAHQENETVELHQRASRWYARAEMANEAIQHALVAEDYGLAVELLESHAMNMIMQGSIKTVSGWARALPEEWASQSPRTNLAFAWMHMLRGTYAQAAPYLERLQKIFGKSQAELQVGEETASLRAEWLALQSLMLYRQDKATESKDTASEALDTLPDQDSRVRSLAYYALASAYWLLEDYPSAVDAYQMSIQYGRAGKNPMAEMLSTISLAGMWQERGQLHQAFEITSQAAERIERSGVLHPISAVVYAALGDVYYQWHQLEDARRHIQRALHLSILGGASSITIFCHVLLARQFLIEGDLEAATNEIQTAVDLVPLEAPEYIWQEVVAQQVSVHLARNRFAAAEMALQGHGFSFGKQFSFPALHGQNIPYALGRLYNSALRILLYQAQTGNNQAVLESGIELVHQLIPRAFEGQQLLVALDALLLRAQMYAALGDHQNGRADLLNALELAEPEGFISIFVEHGQPVAEALEDLIKRNQLGNAKPDYAKRILEAFSGSHPLRDEEPASVSSAGSGPIALIDPLTDRELDVLRSMADGLKYKEIAARLFISLNTVRFHVKTIYGKLSVNNRTQAIERARQLQIL
ncbi:MAG: LuxR C-terminal-related transcriptional regulator, partial [Anaerolineales bacterium]